MRTGREPRREERGLIEPMNILVTAAAGSGEVFAPLSLQNISIE
jgi:hypothetical protein